MSLAFLHKKSWHTANLKNVEQVWLSEQKQAEEDRKLEAWKKDREEERQIEELRRLQRESSGGGGGAAHKERVDFLYEMPVTKQDEYLLGKPIEIKPEESDIKKVEHLPGSSFLAGQNNLSSAANEEFNKMSHDPLVQMRIEEQKALARLMSNPIKMKQIRGTVEQRKEELLRQQVEALGGGGGSSKRDKSHHKKDKKHRSSNKHDKHRKEHKREKEHRRKERHSERRGERHGERDEGKRKRSRGSDSGSGSSSASDDDDDDERASRVPPPPPQPSCAALLPPVRREGYGLVRYSAGQRIEGEGGAADEADAHDGATAASFVPEDGFEGSRSGFVFRSSERGLG
jgi:hypothetical protein